MSMSGQTAQAPDGAGHKRSRSAVLKSLISPSTRTPSPTKPSPVKPRFTGQSVDLGRAVVSDAGILPMDHPHASKTVLSETNQNRRGTSRSPQKKSLSNSSYQIPAARQDGNPTKIHSIEATWSKGKENQTPQAAKEDIRTPIWAQFASQSSQIKTGHDSAELKPEQSRSKHLEDRLSQLEPATRTKSVLPHHHIFEDDACQNKDIPRNTPGTPGEYRKHRATPSLLNSKVGDALRPQQVNLEQINADFEAVLIQRNVPWNMRESMKSLDPGIKAEFIRNSKEDVKEKSELVSSKTSLWNTLRRGRAQSSADDESSIRNKSSSPTKRNRSRGRTDTSSKETGSPSKRARSNSRPRSLFSLRNLSSSSVHRTGLESAEQSQDGPLSPKADEDHKSLRRPIDFVEYLQKASSLGFKELEKIDEAKIKKLRNLLRSESVSWVDTFVLKDGLQLLIGLFEKIRMKDWREESDDKLLHQTLLCLKAVCTTQRAMEKLANAASDLFPHMIAMLFDGERKGPAEYNTRGIIISLLLEHLRAAAPDQVSRRATEILSYLADPQPKEDDTPVDWLRGMKQKRPYLLWCKEFNNVSREVFWMFTHRNHVVPLPSRPSSAVAELSYLDRHFPKTRPPEALNPWVGGVEWDTASYLTNHADLMLALIAATPTQDGRNHFREDLRVSGFESALSVLRTCKEKFYAAPHDALRAWVAAAVEDGWNTDRVRMEPEVTEIRSPARRSAKDDKPPPKLELPDLDIGKGPQSAWCS